MHDRVDVSTTFVPGESGFTLPGPGFMLRLNEGYDNVEYYGAG